MPTKQKDVEVVFSAITQQAQVMGSTPTTSLLVPEGYKLDSEYVVDARRLAKELSTLESNMGDVQAKIQARVDELKVIMTIGSTQIEKSGVLITVVNYDHYNQFGNVFKNEWVKARSCSPDSAQKAFNRYYEQTGLDIPKATDPKSIARQKQREEKRKKLEAIPDINKALDEAVALMDFDLAKELKAENVRRATEANKDKFKALEPIKQSIKDELKLCADKALLEKIVEMLRKGK
jgi:hypothetical protein